MIISFFEEFPTKENLNKIKLITWDTKLYIAAKSVQEFENIQKKIKNRYVKEIIYWPILEKKEGYWISPFAKRKAIDRIYNELKEKNIPVMLDAELPFSRNPWLMLTQLPFFFSNKKKIQTFVKTYPKLTVVEYYQVGKIKEGLLRLFGVSFLPGKHTLVKMAYHSMRKANYTKLEKMVQQKKKEYGSVNLAFGTIAIGVQGNEPLLTSEQLKKDLNFAKRMNMKEIIIFRLGGLNKEYARLLQAYAY